MTQYTITRTMRLKARISENTIALNARMKRRFGASAILRAFIREGIRYHCEQIREARAGLELLTCSGA